MPEDVSSSSSEDETDHVATETTEQQQEPARKAGRLECPEDFVSFCHVPCSSTLADNLRNNQNELWLIKAPASFDPHCLSGVQVPLSGLQTLAVPVGSDQQSYSVLASCRPPDLRLLTGRSRTSAGFVFAPPFSGLLTVCESYGSGGAERPAPRPVPAPPPPAVPAGLRQRFHPFGCKTPKLTYVAESEADGAAFGPSSATLRPLVVKQFVEDGGRVEEEEEEEGGRKRRRKKKKKEKRIKSEEVEVLLQMKREPCDENLDEATEKKKKRKKKKKDREEEEEEEPGVKVKEESVSVKCEPLDLLYGDAAESSGKRRKKKKKKSRTEEEVESS